jgi:hypothetical protein
VSAPGHWSLATGVRFLDTPCPVLITPKSQITNLTGWLSFSSSKNFRIAHRKLRVFDYEDEDDDEYELSKADTKLEARYPSSVICLLSSET